MPEQIGVGVIGCGHWGPNHVRNFHELDSSRVIAVADLDAGRLQGLGKRFPGVELTQRPEDVVMHPEIDAIVVATPTASHYEWVAAALRAGKHVLCEKPICTLTREAEELIQLAEERKRTLMVGHVFLYNDGIQKVKEAVEDGVIGKVRYLHFTRTNLGPIRSDVDVVYDLATHDISIANYLMGKGPMRVSAVGGAYLQRGLPDVAFIHLEYPDGVLASIHVSWLDPKKVRSMTAVGDRSMITWNEMGSLGPVEIFDRGVSYEPPDYKDYGEYQLLLREGDTRIPWIHAREPLRAQAEAFVEAIRSGKEPLSDGRFGIEVLAVVEAAQASLEQDGQFVEVALPELVGGRETV